MKILYLTNSRLPTEKAHGLQIMNMLESFVKIGVEIELLLPCRDNPIKQDIFSYYKKNPVSVKKLWCWDLVSRAPWLGSLAFWVESLTFAWSVRNFVAKNSTGIIIYTRDLWPLVFVPTTIKMVYEIHSIPQNQNWLYQRMVRRMSQIVAITNGLKNNLIRLLPDLSENKILVAPDAVDLRLFQEKNDPTECRAKLQLPASWRDKKIILYTGHLYAWKGVYTMLEAAVKLPEVVFVFVGGTEQDKILFTEKVKDKNARNVMVVGHVNQSEIPDYLGAADVLVLPNSAKVKISAEYTSPLKLFEYMAAGRPIVASCLPSLQEILTNETAEFFTPDDPESLSVAITKTLENSSAAHARALRAKQAVQNFTWDKRARTIINFI